ncbi:MAG: transporter suffix domain-containing protein [Methanothrix sp.]
MKTDIQSLKRWLGMALFVLSFAFYGCLLLVPLTSFSVNGKLALSAALVILGESSFWLSVIILGREAMAKYRNVDWRNRLFGLLKKP